MDSQTNQGRSTQSSRNAGDEQVYINYLCARLRHATLAYDSSPTRHNKTENAWWTEHLYAEFVGGQTQVLSDTTKFTCRLGCAQRWAGSMWKE
jgi:hypothetical protein